MKGFSTHNGDVVVNQTIEIAEESELLRQKVQLVLGTNKGEWKYDEEEGIDFFVVLRKNPDKDEIRNEIEEALRKIDETFTVTEFSLSLTGRTAKVSFKAVNDEGQLIEGSNTYGG